MSNIYITLDYELFFGKNSGTQEKSIIYPTNRLLEVLDKCHVKATFFVDSGYLLKLDEYRKKYSTLEKDYQSIINQITYLNKNGHDIQLHIHPHWEDSFYDGSKWVMDTSRYRLDDFTIAEIKNVVKKYKNILTQIVGEKIFTYRAGGWCIQPFEKIKDALKENNIWLDTTVFAEGYNKSQTHFFDFRNSPKKILWKFEEDPLLENKNGFFTEIPISSYKVSPLFFWKLAFFKKFGGDRFRSFGDGQAVDGSKLDKLRMLTQSTNSVVSIDGYKSSLLQKAFESFLQNDDNENFVVIGHPKALSEFSLEKLEKFIIKNSTHNFTTYSKEFYEK